MLKTITIEKLIPGAFQTRRDFNSTELQELAHSIAFSGIIQPIVVRPLGDQFEIIAGERRYRAAKMLGHAEVPCMVKNYSDEEACAATLVENIQRENLNPIEAAKAYEKLVEDFGFLHEEVAISVGKSRTKISNALRLLRLDKRVQELLIKNELSEGHGKLLAGLPVLEQYPIAQLAITRHFSVRQLEQHLQKKAASQSNKAISSGADKDVARLERILSEQLGSQVQLDCDINRDGGWLKIRFFDHDTLAGLLDRMGVIYEDDAL